MGYAFFIPFIPWLGSLIQRWKAIAQAVPANGAGLGLENSNLVKWHPPAGRSPTHTYLAGHMEPLLYIIRHFLGFGARAEAIDPVCFPCPLHGPRGNSNGIAACSH